MPFCCQCGTTVTSADTFCAKCGTRQPGDQPRTAADVLGGISNRNASLLCYIPMVGWVAAIVVLASERFRNEAHVRFNAFQGLYLFVAWLLVQWVVSPAMYFSGDTIPFPLHGTVNAVLQFLIIAAQVTMIIKVSHNETYKLPIVGELAERSVSEQRI